MLGKTIDFAYANQRKKLKNFQDEAEDKETQEDVEVMQENLEKLPAAQEDGGKASKAVNNQKTDYF